MLRTTRRWASLGLAAALALSMAACVDPAVEDDHSPDDEMELVTQALTQTYSENFSGGQSTPPSSEVCRDWNTFLGSLDSQVTYTAIKLKGSRNETGYTCTGAAANTLCQRIRSDNRSNFSISCNGRTWQTGGCGGGIEVNVNNSGICRCDSGGDEAVVRSCIGNSNWGGFNGATCGGGTQRMDVVCEAAPSGDPPVVQTIANQTNDERDDVSLQVQATDPENQPLVYSATNLPTGVTINASTGLISGRVADDAADNSPYSTVVTVTDSGSNRVDRAFQWTINNNIQSVRTFYSENFTGGQSTPSTAEVCRDWRVFLGQLSANTTYNKVTLKGSRNETGFTCNGANANTICQRIRSDNRSRFSISCDGRTWQMGGCGGGLEVNVNNSGVCTCDNGAQEGVVRPCIGNSNWGGYNGATCGGGTQRMDVICEAAGPNDPPELAVIPNQTSDEGVSISLQTQGTDPERDVLTWSATNLPTGLTINTSTGLISGTMDGTASVNSPYSVVVSLTDSVNDPVTRAFTWTVNDTIQITRHFYSENFTGGQSTPSNSEVCRDWGVFQGALRQDLTYSKITLKGSRNETGFSCTGAEANTLCQRIRSDNRTAFSLTCNGRTWRTGGCGSGLEVNVNNSGICRCDNNGNQAVVRPCIGNSNWGGYNGATCGGGTQRMDVYCEIEGPNETPVVQSIANRTNDERDDISLQVQATDADQNDTLTYSATNLPGGVTINSSTGLISGRVADDAADNSPYSTVVTVTDGRSPVTVSFTWTINNNIQSVRTFYSENFSRGQSTPSTAEVCRDWRVFQGQLSSNTVYNKITLKGSRNETGFTCTGAEANTLCQRIRTDNRSNFSLTCDGRTWRTGGCGGGMEVNVNNGGICSCESGADEAVVRSCIGNSNWGGFNGPTCGGDTQRMDVICEAAGPNDPPVLAPIANQTSDEGVSISLQPSGTDPERDILTWSATNLPTGLTINTGTGLISGTMDGTASANSPYSVVVSLTDGINDPVTRSFTWTVNDTIQITRHFYSENFTGGQQTPSNSEVCRDWGVFLGVLRQDLTYSKVTLKGSRNETGFTCSGATANTICQRIRTDNRSNFSVTCDGHTWQMGGCGSGLEVNVDNSGICRCDSGSGEAVVRPCIGNSNWGGYNGATCGGGTQRMDVICEIEGPNEIPVVQSIANRTNDERDDISLQVQATDGDQNDTLTYSATNLPGGVTINSSTGLISGRVEDDASDNSPYSTVITVTDGRSPVTVSFTWTINNNIQSVRTFYSENFSRGQSTPSDAEVCRDWRVFQGQLSSNTVYNRITLKGSRNETGFTCTGAEANTLCQRIRTDNRSNFSLTCGGRTWRTGGCGGGMEVNVNNGGICSCENGADEAVVRSCIGNSNWGGFNGPTCGGDTQRMDVICEAAGPNDPPEIQTIANQTSDEGATPSVQVEATDPERDVLRYSASNLPSGLTIHATTGVISGTISGSASENSPYTVVVTVTDEINDPVTTSFTWTVRDTIRLVRTFYSENFTGGQNTPSDAEVCRDWRVFQGVLDANTTYSKITLKGSRNETGYTCTGAEANTLCQRIRSDNRSRFSITCNGRTWQTGGCGGGMEVNVNNSGICTCDSGSEEGVVRPCIGNNNWGGYNGATCGGGTQRMDVYCEHEGENGTPVVAAISNQSHDEGVAVSLQVSATDPNDDELTYSATGLPPGLRIDSRTGLIAGLLSFGANENSPYSVVVTVSDGIASATRSFTWTVADKVIETLKVLVTTPNASGHGNPTATVLTNQSFATIETTVVSSNSVTLAQMHQAHVVLVFTNSAPSNASALGDMLADYVDRGGSVVEAPLSQSINTLDIEGRWVSGDYTIVNRTNQNVSSAGTLGTKHAPTHPILSGVNSVTVTNFRTGTTTLKGSTTRIADYNDSQLLTGVRENKNGRVAWVGFYPQTGYSGDALRLLVNALRWTAGAGNDEFNTAPSVTTPPTQRSTEGSSVSLQIAATDANGDDLSFSAQNLPPGLTINTSTGLITGTVGDGDGDSPYTVSITVTDGADPTTVEFSWFVANNLPPTVSITAPTETWHMSPVTVTGTIRDGACDQDPVVQSSLTFNLTGGDGSWDISVGGVGNGRYSPLTVNVTSGCTNLTTSATWRFGVDTTGPTVLYNQLNQNGVDPNDNSTWPGQGGFDLIPTLMQVRDSQSGVVRVVVTVTDTDTNESVTVHTQTNETSGTPAGGPTVSAVTACSVDDHCNDGRLDVGSLSGSNHLMRITTTNAAGGQTVHTRYFRSLGLVGALIAWRDAVSRTLSSEHQGAQGKIDDTVAALNVAIHSARHSQWGSVALTVQIAQSSLQGAKALDNTLDLTASADERDLVGRIFLGLLDARSRTHREEGGHGPTLDVADGFVNQARAADEFSARLNLLANAFFHMEDGADRMVATNFRETGTLLTRIIAEMDEYITHDPELVGRAELATARTELSEVNVLIGQIVANGDSSISDLEHVQLLLGLTNTAESLATAQNNGTWVRNWQWGLTQIVYIYAARGLGNAISFLGQNNPVIREGLTQLDTADGYREAKRADDFMRLLIDSRCLVLSIYNFAYDPDQDPPQDCCEDMLRYQELDNRFPVPDRCLD